MKTRAITSIALLLTALGVILFFPRSCLRPTLTPEVGPMREFSFIYMKHSGPYEELNRKTADLNHLFAAKTGGQCRSVQVFLDDPRAVESSKLRSLTGCRIDGESIAPEMAKIGIGRLRDRFDVGTFKAAKAVRAVARHKGFPAIALSWEEVDSLGVALKSAGSVAAATVLVFAPTDGIVGYYVVDKAGATDLARLWDNAR